MAKAYEPWASSPATRAVMQGNRRRDTAPEMAIRRLLHAAGLRYRVDTRPLPELNRRADLVFRRAKIAVFVDGCYWHGCPEHGTIAKTNADYWATKIGRNVTRDRETDHLLAEAGWEVIRLWEHEDPAHAARIDAAVLRQIPGNDQQMGSLPVSMGMSLHRSGSSLVTQRPSVRKARS